MADLLVPQVHIRLNLLSFCKQSGADIIDIEDEHPPVSAPLRDYLAFFLDEAPKMHEPYVHPLDQDLSDRHRVLRNCRNM